MWEDPIPIVVCSALTTQGSEDALRALDEGAVDVVGKPKIGVADFPAFIVIDDKGNDFYADLTEKRPSPIVQIESSPSGSRSG